MAVQILAVWCEMKTAYSSTFISYRNNENIYQQYWTRRIYTNVRSLFIVYFVYQLGVMQTIIIPPTPRKQSIGGYIGITLSVCLSTCLVSATPSYQVTRY